MDYKQLRDYLSEKHEIAELDLRLNKPLGQPEYYSHSVILDYRKGYPQPRTISGYDTETERQARTRWRRRLEKLKQRTREVEEYIDEISDSRTRRIFTMYFLDGLKEAAIGKSLHVDQALISRTIRDYIRRTGGAG